MSLTIKKNAGSNFNTIPAPAGSHVARCVRLIDLGTQPGQWEGKATFKHKVIVTWELPLKKHTFDEAKGPEPFLVSERYTANIASTNSKLRDMLVSWRGKAFTKEQLDSFSLEGIVGKPCYLTIVHEPKKDGNGVWTRIAGVMALPEGLVCPPQITPTLVFDLDTYTPEIWGRLSDRLKSTIQLSAEWQAKQKQANASVSEADDGPDQDDGVQSDGEVAGDDVPF